MKDTYITPYTIEFKSLVLEDGYYTLDGKMKIDSQYYRKSILDVDINRLSKEEIIHMIESTNKISKLTEEFGGYRNNLFRS